MKINKEYKYWQFFYDETNDENIYPTERDRQCVGSIWSDEWRGLELFEMTDDELTEVLLQDIHDKWRYQGFEGKRANRGLVRHAINELKKIKEEINLGGNENTESS